MITNTATITDPGAGRRSFTYFMFDTREYLSHVFKAETGLSPQKYRSSVRVVR